MNNSAILVTELGSTTCCDRLDTIMQSCQRTTDFEHKKTAWVLSIYNLSIIGRCKYVKYKRSAIFVCAVHTSYTVA